MLQRPTSEQHEIAPKKLKLNQPVSESAVLNVGITSLHSSTPSLDNAESVQLKSAEVPTQHAPLDATQYYSNTEEVLKQDRKQHDNASSSAHHSTSNKLKKKKKKKRDDAEVVTTNPTSTTSTPDHLRLVGSLISIIIHC